jgi:hypothetical protein
LFHGTYGSNKFDEAIDQLLGHTVWARHQRRLGPFTTVRHRNRENVYPSAIEDVVIAADGYGGEHRIVISYESTMDKIAIQVEYNDIPEPWLRTWVGGTADRLRKVLGVGAKVVLVAHQTLPVGVPGRSVPGGCRTAA